MLVPELLGLLSRVERQAGDWVLSAVTLAPSPQLRLVDGHVLPLPALGDLTAEQLAGALHRPPVQLDEDLPPVREDDDPHTTWVELLQDLGSNFWPFDDDQPPMRLVEVRRDGATAQVLVEHRGADVVTELALDGSAPSGIPYDLQHSLLLR